MKLHLKYEGNGTIAVDPDVYLPAAISNSVVATVNSSGWLQIKTQDEVGRLFAAAPKMLNLINDSLGLLEEINGRIVDDELIEYLEKHKAGCLELIKSINI